MSHVIKLDLDPELPLMVWSDLTLLYPRGHVSTGKRRTKATEARVHDLVRRSIREVRKALRAKGKTQDYLTFRDLVVDRLCKRYGFIYIESSRHTILAEDLDDLVERASPVLKRC